jgi:hypothetical protein
MALISVVLPAPIVPQNATTLRPSSDSTTASATSFNPSSESITISFIQKNYSQHKDNKTILQLPSFEVKIGGVCAFIVCLGAFISGKVRPATSSDSFSIYLCHDGQHTTRYIDIATISHKDRLAIIEKLNSFERGWAEDCKVESTNNTWYLFANYLNGFTISISTGEDSIFDDVIVNGR